jgi:hypothetical protein
VKYIASDGGGFRNSGIQEFRNSGIQEFRNSGIQEFRNSGIQEFRNSGIQEFRNPGIQEFRNKRRSAWKPLHGAPCSSTAFLALSCEWVCHLSNPWPTRIFRKTASMLDVIFPVSPRPRMTAIEIIERDVEKLDDETFAAFREWFLAHENARWDRQIERDSGNGKLSALIEEARLAHREGKSTSL